MQVSINELAAFHKRAQEGKPLGECMDSLMASKKSFLEEIFYVAFQDSFTLYFNMDIYGKCFNELFVHWEGLKRTDLTNLNIWVIIDPQMLGLGLRAKLQKLDAFHLPQMDVQDHNWDLIPHESEEGEIQIKFNIAHPEFKLIYENKESQIINIGELYGKSRILKSYRAEAF